MVAWTILALAGLAVVEILNWTAFQPSYRTEDSPADGITVGAAIVFVLLAFFAWCVGLVVIAVIRELPRRRRPPDSVAITHGPGPDRARGLLPDDRPGGRPYDGKWPG